MYPTAWGMELATLPPSSAAAATAPQRGPHRAPDAEDELSEASSSSGYGVAIRESVILPAALQGGSFPVAHDCRFLACARGLGALGLAASAALLGYGLRRLFLGSRGLLVLAQCLLLAVVLALASAACWLRLGAPLSLDLDRLGDLRAGGVWILSLRRRARQAVRCPVRDLSLFFETFGWCDRLERAGARRCGFPTASGGTVHLCFCRGGGGAGGAERRDLVLSASLRDPRTFFTKLRDIMAETAHPLLESTGLYVAEWSDGVAVKAATAGDADRGCASTFG